MLLIIEHLDVAYGHAQVLSDVSINVDQGEMVFVVGRNGAGKTTLLKTIAGFLTPLSGQIVFDGTGFNGIRPEKAALAGVRYVFQDKRVFSKLTVRENIQLAAYATGEGLEAAREMVVRVFPGVERFWNSAAGGLSGGQRQLLLLGRALIGSPRLLLIDEPTEGLAAGMIAEVFKVLEMMKGKLSLIIVEQNLAVVCRLADRVYAVKEGRIAAELKGSVEIQDHTTLEKHL